MDSSIMLRQSFKLATFQIYFRFFSFFINLIAVRFVDKEVIGIVNVRLMLLYTTAVFITREPFRKVCVGLASEKNIRCVFDLVWLIVPLSIVTCSIFSIIWSELFNIDGYNEYKTVVFIYGLAAMIELLSEPLWIYGQMNLLITLRVVIEASSLLLKVILSTLLYFTFPSFGLYSFAVAQIVYSLFITITYFLYFYFYFNSEEHTSSLLYSSIKTYKEIFPRFFQYEVKRVQAKMVFGFVLNCILKQVLTEGERYLMTISNWISLEMQGEFDIISNLGSLAPRLVFSSVEDSCHLAFSKMLKQGVRGSSQNNDSLKQSFTILTVTLKFVIFLGTTILVFAQAYSWTLLVLYAGFDKATLGAPLLRVFALYVFLLAINGVTESFYYSVITQKELNFHTYRMIGFSIIFVVCGGTFVSFLGTVGVIWANCLNMLLRIFISLRFISYFFKDTEYSLISLIKSSFPDLIILVAFLGSLFVTLMSMGYFESSFEGQLYHILVGIVSICFTAGTVLSREAVLMNYLRDKLRISKVKSS